MDEAESGAGQGSSSLPINDLAIYDLAINDLAIDDLAFHAEALRAMVHNITGLAVSVCRHTEGRPGISHRLAHDLVQRIGQIFNNSNEMRALDSLGRLRSDMRNLCSVEQYHLIKNLGMSNYDADMILNMLKTTRGIRKKSLERGLTAALNRSLNNYKAGVYRSFIRGSLPLLMKELVDNVAALEDISEKMEHYFGISSAGWDYTKGHWQEIPWDIFSLGKQLLEDDPSISRLANILGRGLDRGAGKAHIETVEAEQIQEQEYLGKMEILGVEFGQDINLLFPSQYTLLTDPDTEYRFYKELIDGQLLVSRYRNLDSHVKTIFHRNKTKKTLGPVIICLDSSGSMAGWPERVAKSLCLALLNVCWKMKRKLYLILFSTRIKTLDLSDMDANLPDFAQFFAMEFRGGTDLRPALRASVQKIGEEQYANADLLIISDFRVPKIMIGQNRVLDRIREQSQVHALTIGQSPCGRSV